MIQTSSSCGPAEHPNPTTQIGSKMGGELTYPEMVPLLLTHSHVGGRNPLRHHVQKPWCLMIPPANTNNRYGFNHAFKVVRNGFRPATARLKIGFGPLFGWF